MVLEHEPNLTSKYEEDFRDSLKISREKEPENLFIKRSSSSKRRAKNGRMSPFLDKNVIERAPLTKENRKSLQLPNKRWHAPRKFSRKKACFKSDYGRNHHVFSCDGICQASRW